MINKYNILRFWGHREMIPFGIRDRLLRRLHPVGTPFEFEVPFYSKRYHGNTKSYLDWCVFFYGAYEKYLLNLLEQILTRIEHPVVFDIGANVGHHSLFISSYADMIHAFEPHPEFCQSIEAKIKLNKLTNLMIHNVGLGAEDASIPYFAPTEDQPNKGTGSFIEGYNSGLRPYNHLRVVNGDNYIDQINPAKIDLVKIDVEGFEFEVLTGLKASLSKFRPILIIEFSEQTAQKFESLKKLKEHLPVDYQIFEVVGGGIKKLKPFNYETSRGDIICFDPNAILISDL